MKVAIASNCLFISQRNKNKSIVNGNLQKFICNPTLLFQYWLNSKIYRSFIKLDFGTISRLHGPMNIVMVKICAWEEYTSHCVATHPQCSQEFSQSYHVFVMHINRYLGRLPENLGYIWTLISWPVHYQPENSPA